MLKALAIVATVAVAAIAVWSQPPSGYICGKVFWNKYDDDSGASCVDVYAQPDAGGPTKSTETNCCGLYAFDGLAPDAYYLVWAIHQKNVTPPCAHAGSLCDTTINAGTLHVKTDTVDVDFDLALDSCANAQTPCPNPCPDSP